MPCQPPEPKHTQTKGPDPNMPRGTKPFAGELCEKPERHRPSVALLTCADTCIVGDHCALDASVAAHGKVKFQAVMVSKIIAPKNSTCAMPQSRMANFQDGLGIACFHLLLNPSWPGNGGQVLQPTTSMPSSTAGSSHRH